MKSVWVSRRYVWRVKSSPLSLFSASKPRIYFFFIIVIKAAWWCKASAFVGTRGSMFIYCSLILSFNVFFRGFTYSRLLLLCYCETHFISAFLPFRSYRNNRANCFTWNFLTLKLQFYGLHLNFLENARLVVGGKWLSELWKMCRSLTRIRLFGRLRSFLKTLICIECKLLSMRNFCCKSTASS